MADCWLADPNLRPSFMDLRLKFEEALLEGEKQVN
jgi:hypothetical protein